MDGYIFQTRYFLIGNYAKCTETGIVLMELGNKVPKYLEMPLTYSVVLVYIPIYIIPPLGMYTGM